MLCSHHLLPLPSPSVTLCCPPLLLPLLSPFAVLPCPWSLSTHVIWCGTRSVMTQCTHNCAHCAVAVCCPCPFPCPLPTHPVWHSTRSVMTQCTELCVHYAVTIHCPHSHPIHPAWSSTQLARWDVRYTCAGVYPRITFPVFRQNSRLASWVQVFARYGCGSGCWYPGFYPCSCLDGTHMTQDLADFIYNIFDWYTCCSW